MGDMQRIQRINQKLDRINNWLQEYKEDRQEMVVEMGSMVGLEFLNAFEELAKLDQQIEILRREKICLETLRDYIE